MGFKNIYKITNAIIVFIGVSPWILYATTLNIGLDSLVDEGLTLLLLGKPKPLYMTSQSGLLIGLVSDQLINNTLGILWLRFIMQLISVTVLCVSSLFYLKTRKKITNTYHYIGIFFLVNSISLFLFTKTVSYNHLQQFLILHIISLILLVNIYKNTSILKNIILFTLGTLFAAVILNIITSGILIVFFTILVIYLQSYSSTKIFLLHFVPICIGFGVSIICFHFYLKDIHSLYIELNEMINMHESLNRSYDTYSLFFKFAKSLLLILSISILSLGILHLYILIKEKFCSNFVAYLITMLSLCSMIIFWINYTTNGLIYEWFFAPVIIGIFLSVQKSEELKTNKTLILFLLLVPFIAPFGTNLLITEKLGYYLGAWFIASVLIVDELNSKYYISTIFIVVYLFFIFNIINHLLINNKECTEKSTKIKRLRNIYISSKQKEHFENTQSILLEKGYVKGDTILAFQPDLMTLYAVEGNSGKRVYFVPSDFLNENISQIKRPKFIILNEFSYGQITKFIKCWNFPEQYEKVNIGSPETKSYFNSDKSRYLYCLKRDHK